MQVMFFFKIQENTGKKKYWKMFSRNTGKIQDREKQLIMEYMNFPHPLETKSREFRNCMCPSNVLGR